MMASTMNMTPLLLLLLPFMVVICSAQDAELPFPRGSLSPGRGHLQDDWVDWVTKEPKEEFSALPMGEGEALPDEGGHPDERGLPEVEPMIELEEGKEPAQKQFPMEEGEEPAQKQFPMEEGEEPAQKQIPMEPEPAQHADLLPQLRGCNLDCHKKCLPAGLTLGYVFCVGQCHDDNLRCKIDPNFKEVPVSPFEMCPFGSLSQCVPQCHLALGPAICKPPSTVPCPDCIAASVDDVSNHYAAIGALNLCRKGLGQLCEGICTTLCHRAPLR